MTKRPILPMAPTPTPGNDPMTEDGFKFAITQADAGTVDNLVQQMMVPFTRALAGGVPWYTLAYTAVLLFVSLLLTLQECFPIAKGIKVEWMVRGIQVIYIKSLEKPAALDMRPIETPALLRRVPRTFGKGKRTND